MKHVALSDANIYIEIAYLVSHIAPLILYSLAKRILALAKASVALDGPRKILQWQILDNIRIALELQNDLSL